MRGKLIVIDGPDGTGKKTHTRLLYERLIKEGIPVKTTSFPDYASPTGKRVLDYLHGKFGTLDEVDPYFAAQLYIDDRLAAKPKLIDWLNDGYHVLLDRYVSSNDSHQGSKFKGEERIKFLKWSHEQEFEKNGLPRPDHLIYLRLNPDITVDSINQRKLTEYQTDKEAAKRRVKDLHEENADHLRGAYEVYEYLAETSENWITIACAEGTHRPPIEIIHERIWGVAKPLFKLTEEAILTG